MFCPRCGTANPEGQFSCGNCGTPLSAPNLAPKPQSYLVWSIITTVLCCVVGGVVAIVYSAKVDSLYNAGDYAGAEAASRSAKGWNIGSMIAGFVFNAIYLTLMIVGILSERH